MHLIAFFQQKFCQIRSILTGHPGDKCALSHNKVSPAMICKQHPNLWPALLQRSLSQNRRPDNRLALPARRNVQARVLIAPNTELIAEYRHAFACTVLVDPQHDVLRKREKPLRRNAPVRPQSAEFIHHSAPKVLHPHPIAGASP
jgi:hypothetical protein